MIWPAQYDEEANAFYINMDPLSMVAWTKTVPALVNVDYDQYGQMMGVEIILDIPKTGGYEDKDVPHG